MSDKKTTEIAACPGKRWRKVNHTHNHDIILDDSPMPKGRSCVVRNQIALVNITLPDGPENSDLIVSAPTLVRQVDELKAERDDLLEIQYGYWRQRKALKADLAEAVEAVRKCRQEFNTIKTIADKVRNVVIQAQPVSQFIGAVARLVRIESICKLTVSVAVEPISAKHPEATR